MSYVELTNGQKKLLNKKDHMTSEEQQILCLKKERKKRNEKMIFNQNVKEERNFLVTNRKSILADLCV